jgi:hypothetical protein
MHPYVQRTRHLDAEEPPHLSNLEARAVPVSMQRREGAHERASIRRTVSREASHLVRSQATWVQPRL